jgi:glycosyltransferase involved in cell wall biosynthesis
MKKLCLIVPDLHKGGMERVMAELANYFYQKEDTIVHIILLLNQAKIFYKIPPEVSVLRPSFTFSNKWRLLSTIRTLFFLRRTIRRLDPDSVLSFGETYNSFVLLSCLFLKTRVFVSDRSRPDKKWGFIQENLRRILYPQAAGIVAQTTYSRNFLAKETGHKNIRVIPNPIREFEKPSVEKENIILNVGRLIKSKRIDLLLNIFSKCENKDWVLWIVGENETGNEELLVKLSEELKIADRVKFWGKQEDMNRFYGLARIFAFTSESEGLPNVLLEAMGAGLACISFDCIAGPRDLIDDGVNGYLVRLHDCETYASKLNTLIEDPEIREIFSKNAVKKTGEFDIHIIGEKFYNFLLS